MERFKIIGLMSGTSLDGVDLAACEFTFKNDLGWSYELCHTRTIPYSDSLSDRLAGLHKATAELYAQTDHELGRFYAQAISDFMSGTHFKPDYISSHGHTIFHQPSSSFTTQIGHPSAISALTQIPTIADFRSIDVHLGGQGAPLVPIGDLLLFPDHACCLNLGGIGNVSIKHEASISSYDICPVNMALNYLAGLRGLSYDHNGEMSSTGQIIPKLLDALNRLSFYQESGPKSLGKEWFEDVFLPILDLYLVNHDLTDVLRTVVEHISLTIAQSCKDVDTILITGGGARNGFLIDRLKALHSGSIVIPEPALVDYKEALIFAFLGALYITGKKSILTSVTGSSSDHIGGCLYQPFRTS